MTNEKAIEVLTEINYESIREDVVQATNMAIKSLSEQYKFEQRKKQVEKLGQIYMNFITEQPMAEREWVQYKSLQDFGNYNCSNYRHIEHKIDGYKYCPNCGVKIE